MDIVEYIAKQRVKPRTNLMRDSVMSRASEPEWQPEYERKGGHALEAPMISPDDLIGSGLPTKAGALLAKLGAGKLGGLGLAGMVKFSPEEIARAMAKFDLVKSKAKRHPMHDGFGTDELSGVASDSGMFWGPGATKNMGKVETVPLSSLTPTQYELDTQYIPELLKQGMPGDSDLLEAIRMNGKTYIQDGHHRFNAMALAGKPDVRVKVANAVGTGPEDWVVKPNVSRHELDDGLIYDYLSKDVQKKLDHDYDFDKLKKSNPAEWAKAQSDALFDVSGVREYPMLQGLYRGYAGDRSTPDAMDAGKQIFATPQREAAERYSTKRATEGRDPHLEMLMVDPFAGRKYGHGVAGTAKDRSIMTQARELSPEDIQNVHQFYKQGGLVKDAKGVYGDPRADYETAKAAVSGFTGLGERPSVMTGGADTYDKLELAGLLSNLMPGKATIGGLAAMATPISRAKMLAALYGKSHPSYKEILNAKVPEEVIAALSPELARTKNPVMDKLARRWEVNGRDLYDPGVVHYDVSGGYAIPDIIRAQKGFAQELLDVPSNIEEYLASLYSKGQMRTMDLGKLDKNNTIYVPHDPWYGSRPPNLEGRNMFYVNEIEGNSGIARAPSRVDIESILNEPELRRELNLSLAVPEESTAHKGSKVYKKSGGLVRENYKPLEFDGVRGYILQ